MAHTPESGADLLGLLPFGEDRTGLLSEPEAGTKPKYLGRITYDHSQSLLQGYSEELSPYIIEVDYPSEVTPEPLKLHKVAPPAEIATRYDRGLQAAALGLADGSLHGRVVSGLVVITERLAHTWREGETLVSLAEGLLIDKANVVYGLSYAIGMLEGNTPPNGKQGYCPDLYTGVKQRPQVAAGRLQAAYDKLRANPDLFGGRQTAAELSNGITGRLEAHRPTTSDGEPIGPPFPRLEF